MQVNQQAQIDLANEMLVAYRKRNPDRYAKAAAAKPQWNVPGKEACNHLKGGSLRLFGARHRDYAVFFHRYPDGRAEIKCMICGHPWGPKDPDWQAALDMVAQSSNHPSSSEIVLSVPPRVEPIPKSVVGNALEKAMVVFQDHIPAVEGIK